jgi:hypothetical protein
MASIEFDIDDILNGMMGYEKQELADELYDDGYSPSQLGEHPDDRLESDFDREVNKLIGNSWRLSIEDEATILAIARKIIQ